MSLFFRRVTCHAISRPLCLPLVAVMLTAATSSAVAQQLGTRIDATPADEANDDSAQSDQPEADPFAVPDGTPAELIEYLRGLLQRRPSATEREKMAKAVDEASQKILAGEPNDEQLNMVVSLQSIIHAGSPDKLQALAEKLEKMDKPKFVHDIKRAILQAKLRRAMFMPGEQGQEEARKLVDEALEFLGQGELGPRDARFAMTVARVAEQLDPQLGLQTYQQLAQAFSETEDPQMARIAEMFEATVRRLELPGNQMELSGPTVDGGTFNLDQFEGKLVLVDFWASWCGPCRASLPHLKQLYEAYKDDGFAIVGPSVDRDPEALKEFLEETPIPWPIVIGEDGPAEAANYYGIMAVPTYVLVDTDGKVISAGLNPTELDDILAERFGPIQDHVEADKPAEEAASK